MSLVLAVCVSACLCACGCMCLCVCVHVDVCVCVFIVQLYALIDVMRIAFLVFLSGENMCVKTRCYTIN